jgi:8-oxo-dGTP pyrophosphatase MutT (NUDIX family)
MYEIYSNGHRLVLAGAPPEHPEQWALVLKYRGKIKSLHAIADTLEKRPDPANYWLYADDPEALWDDYRGLFAAVPAAGGVVKRPDGAWLFILRKDFLDLPKGKLDPGEDFATAAHREVLEETGLKEVTSGPLLAVTWHAYREKKQRCLKETRWFAMSDPVGEPRPQQEEGISEVRWMRPEDYLNASLPRFRNLDAMVSRLLLASES